MAKSRALHDAKNRFSEVVDRAADDGPQTVTRRGEPVAVVLSVEEYRRLVSRRGRDFVEHLLAIPKGEDLDIERDRTPPREVDFE